MAPIFDFSGETVTTKGNIACWRDVEDRYTVEHIVVYGKETESAQLLVPFNGKNVSETGLKSITGTPEGLLNATIDNMRELDKNAVLNVQVREVKK